MQNEEGQMVDLYVPRNSATNRIITAKDHASVQINIGHVDENGLYDGRFTTFALSGFIRAQATLGLFPLRLCCGHESVDVDAWESCYVDYVEVMHSSATAPNSTDSPTPTPPTPPTPYATFERDGTKPIAPATPRLIRHRLSPPPAAPVVVGSKSFRVGRYYAVMMARCHGAAGVRARWPAGALAGAFLDVALVWACLCAAAGASAASRLLALFGLRLPCTCARPHLPCLLGFLCCYPSRALASVLSSLRSHFPFAAHDHGGDDDDSSSEEEAEPVGGEEEPVDGDLKQEVVEERDARAALQRELEKERSAAASAAEEAMAMILRLQKEKSALEIEAHQQRRTADERCAFYEDEVEELRDIVLVREREARALQKEVDAYRRLLGLATEDDDDDDEMVTPHSTMLEGEPSSSRSVNTNCRNFGMPQLGNDSVFSFKTPILSQDLVLPIHVDHVKGINEDKLSVDTSGKVPMVELEPEVHSCEDDGAETVEILSLSAGTLDKDGDVEVVAAVDTKPAEELPDEFQEVECGAINKIDRDFAGSESDANIYDVHVVDDICFSTEAKGLIGRSFSDATMQAEKLQNRVAADELLGRSLSAIKGAQDKIKLAASERKQSLQLQLLEDIANQLQEIKDAAETGRRLHCASPKNSKKS
ncbi:hypothetical protein ABZP36_003846 [Zizania latifolia]